jgi:type I restriction enzyme S subunit
MSFSEWKEYKLEDVTINYNSKRVPLSSKERELRQGKYPYYGAQGVIDFIDKFIFEGQYLLIAEDGANLETRNEDIARLTKNQEQFWVNNHAHILRSNENSDIRYIKYFLNKSDLSGYITGSAQPKLNKANLNSIRMVLPPFEEQKAIAHILSTLDDKIEVNNQINKTLENMAQTIFKQWFVDFEFPNEDGEPYKSSGGEMIESELGMIPKGWEVVKLNSVVDICYGKNLPTKNLLSDGYPVFGGNGQIGFYSEYLYEKSQVLIACRGAASGKVIISLPYSFVTNNSLVLEQNGMSVTHEYLKQFCLENEFYNYATGSAQPQITIANLANANILIPQRDLMNMFSLIRNSIDHEVLSLFNENNKLVAIRDALLPKLMSGELRVSLDAEDDAS